MHFIPPLPHSSSPVAHVLTLFFDVHDDSTPTNEAIAKRDSRDIIGKRDSEIAGRPGPERTTYHLQDLVPLKTVGTGTFGRVKCVRHSQSGIYNPMLALALRANFV